MKLPISKFILQSDNYKERGPMKSLLLIIIFSNCVTYIPKLPLTEEARERNIRAWYYRDYAGSKKREENISHLGQKYLDFVQRPYDDSLLLWIKIQFATLELMILQNALRAVFYEDNLINQVRFRGNKGEPLYVVKAKSFDEFFKIEINKVPHYFILITVSEDLTVYNEIIVIKKDKKYLETFKTPVLKTVIGDQKIGFYTKRTDFGRSDQETKEYVLDSFRTLKKHIEQGKIQFETLDIERKKENFVMIQSGKDRSSMEYDLNFKRLRMFRWNPWDYR